MNLDKKGMKLFLKFCLLVIVFSFTSCVDNIDFNQADDIEITPAVNVALMNFDITQNDIAIPGMEIVNPLSQTSEFTALDNHTARENLERVKLNFEINNQFNRNFRLEFIFLDEADNMTDDAIVLNVDANNANFTLEEEIIVANNASFLRTRKIQIRLTLLPSTDGSIVDVNVPSSLIFKSAGTFYFRTN